MAHRYSLAYLTVPGVTPPEQTWIAARAGYAPQAAVTLWRKMGEATGNQGGLEFLSTHPSGPDRIRELQDNVPKVQGLYQAALRNR